MTTIVGEHCADKAVRRRERENRVGRLWTEEDFETLNLDKFGIDVEVLAGNKKPSRLFRAWKENWEEEVLKKQDPVFAARLARKYGGSNGVILIMGTKLWNLL